MSLLTFLKRRFFARFSKKKRPIQKPDGSYYESERLLIKIKHKVDYTIILSDIVLSFKFGTLWNSYFV